MPFCDWKDENWKTLIYSIKRGKCILMLGPEAAAREIDGEMQPLTSVLAQQLAPEIPERVKTQIDCRDLQQVLQNLPGEDYGGSDLSQKVAAFYDQHKESTTALHRDLAALPFKLAITTTPDNMFPKALEECEKSPQIGWYNFRGGAQANPSVGENPLVFYLYGHPGEPDSLLLTENDLLDFLVSLISRNPELQASIRKEFKDKENSFLFLGFGFKQWYLRILLHALQDGNPKRHRSFALEPMQAYQESANITDIHRNVFFFKRSDYRIQIFKQDFHEFARELRERYGECAGQISTQQAEQDKAKVFISYATEDKEFAHKLYQNMEDAGLNPWRDRENLRGGDNWEEVIAQVIGNADYFVLLQSRALENRKKSIVFQELHEALKQQKRFKPGSKFIIPTKIDDCSLLENLKHIHSIDLSGKKDMMPFIKNIKRDFEKRKNQ